MRRIIFRIFHTNMKEAAAATRRLCCAVRHHLSDAPLVVDLSAAVWLGMEYSLKASNNNQVDAVAATASSFDSWVSTERERERRWWVFAFAIWRTPRYNFRPSCVCVYQCSRLERSVCMYAHIHTVIIIIITDNSNQTAVARCVAPPPSPLRVK